jgi:predicted Zn-dependent peptidase
VKTANSILIAAAVLLGAASCAVAASAGTTAELPRHPRDLKYGPLKFDVPDPGKYQYKLKNGLSAWIAEDFSLPLVNVSLKIRAGQFLAPERPGLAGLTGSLMRKGGAGDLTAEQFDERADFLAAEIGSSAGDTEAGVSMNCIVTQLDACLDLMFAMLETPRFQEDRIKVEKDQILEQMKQRNDDAQTILSREWAWLMYGESAFSSRKATKAELDALTRDDLVAFHRQWWRPEPGNMIVTASGAVKAQELIAKLDQRFAGWKAAGPKVPWPPALPAHAVKPGLYHVEKDIPQAKVLIGHRTIQWDPKWQNPDAYALQVMNDVLGGGGFTSRITKRVRSDEGLAYSAGSSLGIGNYWPGAFSVFFQTKSPTVAFASEIAMEEIASVQEKGVTADELATSRNQFVETFPQNFESPADTVGIFAADEYIGRPHAYWQNYRAAIGKVTSADVQRVAKQYLKQPEMAFLVVGKWAEIEKGDADGKATMKQFFGGNVTKLPLRDPLTLKPLP